jgi:hypothetical protein
MADIFLWDSSRRIEHMNRVTKIKHEKEAFS